MINSEESDFWIAQSLYDPVHECFVFRRDGTEVRVKIWNGRVDRSSLRLHHKEQCFIERYFAQKEIED